MIYHLPTSYIIQYVPKYLDLSTINQIIVPHNLQYYSSDPSTNSNSTASYRQNGIMISTKELRKHWLNDSGSDFGQLVGWYVGIQYLKRVLENVNLINSKRKPIHFIANLIEREQVYWEYDSDQLTSRVTENIILRQYKYCNNWFKYFCILRAKSININQQWLHLFDSQQGIIALRCQ